MKAIIYYRKSTDRDDKQANTLEHQLNNCRNTARNLGLEIVQEIGESISAKEEFKRPGFNEMIDICKKKKIDFIIIDESKRLSRNNIDTSRIVDLMDKKCIRGIYSTWRAYLSDQSHDKFLLQLDLSLSKMDNEDRAKDTRDKMLSCVRNGKCMTKVPFGYKNITIRKWHKDVIVDETKREAIREVFEMRKKAITFLEITKFLARNYPDIGKVSIQLLKKMTVNKFYYGMMKFSGIDYPGKHEPIITKKLFDEAAQWGNGGYIVVNKGHDYILKWLLRDHSGIKLVAYNSKDNVYYMSQSRSEYRVNIKEERVFEKAEEYLKQFAGWARIHELNRKVIMEVIKERETLNASKLVDIDTKIESLHKRKSELFDMRLDGLVSDDIYSGKLNQITNDILGLEQSRQIYSNQHDVWDLFEKMIELSKGLHQAYASGDRLRRAQILKKTMIELLVDNKKELVFKENELFCALKSAENYDGNATENWTPVYGMKTRYPNH